MSLKLSRRGSAIATSLLVSIFCFASASLSQGQTFNSGSTGADGALNLTTPGTIIFDPKSFTPPLNPAGDNVYNFTTINIASGVTVKLSSNKLSGPIYWLAQGSVTISGALNLDGEPGATASNFASNRIPSAAGAGGFGGGVGGGGGLAPQPGNGPGAGAAATTRIGSNGTFTGSQYLIPLVGGSGGGGALNGVFCGGTYGGGGGAGGGAILIASSTTITLGPNTSTGFPTSSGIYARGGAAGNCDGGSGSGGAIRLIANTVTTICAPGCPAVDAHGVNGNDGLIRVEAFNPNLNDGGNVWISGSLIKSAPFLPLVPVTAPSALKVVSLVANGVTIPINANPFSFPDATINSSTPVTVNVQGQFIPLGTLPQVIVMSETGPDQTINCSALQGTFQQSTCSVSITFPTGGSRGFVKATWTQ